MEEIFSKSTTTHKFLANCYSYLPLDGEIVGSDGWLYVKNNGVWVKAA